MLDRQWLYRYGSASSLALATVFVALSLLGYNPADAPGSAADPPNDPTLNPCGPVGATLAYALIQSFGWASLLLLEGLASLVVLAFRRRAVPEKGIRSLGFLILISVVAATFHKSGIRWLPSPPVGSGGVLGALIALFLEAQVGPYGLFLILAALGLVGMVLAHEVLFVWPARELTDAFNSLRRRRDERVDEAPETAVPAPALMLENAKFSVVGARTIPPPPISKAPAFAPPMTVASRTIAHPLESRGAIASTSVPTPQPIVTDGSYHLPPLELLEPSPPFPIQEHEAKINARALLLERTLLDFGYQVRVVQIDTGPVITQFEIELEAGLRVSRIISLADDLAIALAVPSVRIVAPIPGKTTVGIEVPNDRRATVKLGEVITTITQQSNKQQKIPLYLGKDVKGVPLAFDLADMPHLLIAGRTGTGKSVCLNAMILSILRTKRPDEVKLILIDPKMVELSQFKRIPHLMHPVVTDMKKAESLLSWACDKMDERYTFLARAGVRNIQTYNQLTPEEIYERLRPEDDEERSRIPTFMPYIVIIADEMADLMMTAAKEVESHIVRLAQKSRAVGMHLIVATQKPTVDVITGLIKGNLPARIAFQVASRGDSRVVLDEMGADKLLGNGDMLFLFPGTSHIVRAQGTYVSDAEVHRICGFLEQYPLEFSRELMQMQVGGGPGGKERGAALKERDELYEPAIEIVVREGRGSCSLLQRALGIGYGRAARLIDFMAEDGIVGEFKSGSAREVLYSWDEWEALKNGESSSGNAA